MPTPETMNFIIFITLLLLSLIGFFVCVFFWIQEIKHDREDDIKRGTYNDPQGD